MFETLVDAFRQALDLILSGDPEVLSVVLRSLYISGLATLLSSIVGIPLAVALGLSSFPGKKAVRGLFNALLGVPTVALGLVLYLLFSRSGPLGVFQLLYTPLGMSIGQALLIAPIMISFGVSAVESTDVELRDLARTLGASSFQTGITVVRESMWGIALAIIAAFNRGIAELGIAMMIGGNIRYVTRVLTTSIALETARGEVVLSIALAMILMTIVLTVTVLLSFLRRE
ncbi:MAG: ABC transporter permease [archaeon]